MARERFDVEIPDGQHLGFSRDTDGAYRAHLFDDKSNDLVGHAELFEPSVDAEPWPNIEYIYVSEPSARHERELSDEELDEAFEALLNLGLIVALLAVKAAPHVTSWWRDKALPAMRSTGDNALSAMKSANRNALQSIRSKSGTALLTVKSAWNNKSIRASKVERGVVFGPDIPVTEPAHVSSSTELDVSFHDYRARMGSAEARERFVAALVARAFSDRQMRTLRNARIEDDGGRPSLESAMDVLTPQQVEDTIVLMLERNPSLLDRESMTELSAILSGNNANGERASLIIERPKGNNPVSHLAVAVRAGAPYTGEADGMMPGQRR